MVDKGRVRALPTVELIILDLAALSPSVFSRRTVSVAWLAAM